MAIIENQIKLRITTDSNCLIGGAQQSYKIGGIDEFTVVDENGNPKITASTFKGAFKNLMKEELENGEEFNCIEEVYEKYFNYIEKLLKDRADDEITNIINNITNSGVATNYLFGIEGFSNSPKLLFYDFYVVENDSNDYFSIDSKNSIEEKYDEISKQITISSNPRTYKTIRRNVRFEGEINFYKFNEFVKAGVEKEKIDKIIDVIKNQILKFNDGIYRIGNSKSRGYGKIKIEII